MSISGMIRILCLPANSATSRRSSGVYCPGESAARFESFGTRSEAMRQPCPSVRCQWNVFRRKCAIRRITALTVFLLWKCLALSSMSPRHPNRGLSQAVPLNIELARTIETGYSDVTLDEVRKLAREIFARPPYSASVVPYSGK